MAYPLPGALLPYNRIIAFTEIYIQDGHLRRNSRAEMIKNYRKWLNGRPQILRQQSLLYIIVTAQGAPGRDNMYRMRMPFKQIDTVLKWAKPSMLWCFRYPSGAQYR
jgi:hypothetical protein